jgi:uncharacterized membrane protein
MNKTNRYWLSMLVLSVLFLFLMPTSLAAQENKTDLNLRLLPGDFYQGLQPGAVKTVYLEVRNNGVRALTDIRFSAAIPENWKVIYRPERLAYLATGSSYTVDADIVPADGAGRGDYTINLIAEALETRAATSVFLQVEGGAGYWLWVGVGIAVLVATGFVVVFMRESRN